jgi:hypothetical protein
MFSPKFKFVCLVAYVHLSEFKKKCAVVLVCKLVGAFNIHYNP